MKNIIIVFISVACTNIYAQIKPILLGNQNGVCEPSIMVDHNNPNNIVAGSVYNSVYASTDGGETWTDSTLRSTYGVWGDPVIIVGNKGDFYYFHLSNPPKEVGNYIDRIVCQESTDGGLTWSAGTYAGLNGSKVQDKHWITVDRANDIMYMTWTQFDAYDSREPLDSSVILFSKSADWGDSWSDPVRLSRYAGNCVDSDSTTEGAVPAMGINGEIFVAWAMDEKIYFDKSLDGGETWLDADIVVADQPGGWDYPIPGLYRCNGLPTLISDTSSLSKHRGNLYVVWTDQRNGEDNTDVWIATSTDSGNTWTKPKKVNQDKKKSQQFMCWPAVDPITGNLYVVYYDRRGLEGNKTNVYLACSNNAGKSWIEKKISFLPFEPNSFGFFGDYTNVVAHNNKIYPIWTEMEGFQTRIYTAIIEAEDLKK